ncbi:MAG: LysR family transcriptional regulator [Polyangiaceae bacterium]|nr:LysR family transcriptional regulator [Polyangiaceae bacterium]
MYPADLRGLFAFVQVVQAESFSGAARRLGITKSAVSKLVAGAEASLGVQLLVRTTRKVSLTEVGETVYQACARLGEDLEAARAAASSQSLLVVGRLRVAAPAVLGRNEVVPLVADFMAQNPRVSVDLILGDRAVDLVADRIDVALRVRHTFPDSTLIVRRLAAVRLYLCASPAYLKQHGTPAHPRDLSHHQFVGHIPSSDEQQLTLQRKGTKVSLTPRGHFSSDDGAASVAAAQAGLGLVVAPDFEVNEGLSHNTLSLVLPEWKLEPLTLAALYPQQRQVPAKIRAFVGFVAERWETPPWHQRG